MAQLLETMRAAIRSCGRSRYRIAKDSGISAGQLSRLVNGKRGLSVESIEKLADCLGLRITIEPKPTARKAR